MRLEDAWKNFHLGEELSVAGTFIYNGLRRFNSMDSLDYTEEVFEFYYNLAVGLERLLKVAVVLLEHDDKTNQESLEASLITHNHLELLNRVKAHVKLSFGEPQIGLLSLLGTFYTSHRYDRFSLSSVRDMGKERKSLYTFLSKFLNVEVQQDTHGLFATRNEERFKRFVHRTVFKISSSLYQHISDRARELNLYTYELRYGSKAFSVFVAEVDPPDEDVLWKELLVFLMNTKAENGMLNFIRKIEPLDFDPAEIKDYLQCFASDMARAYVMDELEHHYSELEKSERKERLELMSVIGDPQVFFPEDDDDIEDVHDIKTTI